MRNSPKVKHIGVVTKAAPKTDMSSPATELALKVMDAHSDEISSMVAERVKTSKSDYETFTGLENDLGNFMANVFADAWHSLRNNPATAGTEFVIPPFVGADLKALVREAIDRYGKGTLNDATVNLYFDMGGLTFCLVAPGMGDIASSVEEYDRVNGTEFSDMVDADAWYTAGRRPLSNAITIYRFDEAYDKIHAASRVNRNRRRPARESNATRKTKGARR